MRRTNLLAILLALTLLLGALPMTAAAADAPLLRSEAILCLWEDAGKPEPSRSIAPFADLDPSAEYYPAVLWAFETGLTDGTGDGRFRRRGS